MHFFGYIFPKVKIAVIIPALFSMTVSGQPLYMPYNVQEAYNNAFRSYDGKPGEKYFQNKSSYRIKAGFNPETRVLKGRARIVYQNNSQEILTRIVMRLYPDYFKKGNPRDKAVHPADVHEGVLIKHLSVNDSLFNVNDPAKIIRSGTLMIINLEEDLLMPGKSLEISIGWEFMFPGKTTERFGTYHNTSFFVAYWYPQIAVFDDIDGWDYTDYNGTQEFYNDFSDFNCEITVPSDYLTWATGEWLNADDILSPQYLQRYNEAKTAGTTVQVISPDEIGKISKNRKSNTFKYTASNVTDFAFAVSKNYTWDMKSIQCSETDEPVIVHALYPSKSGKYNKVTDITSDAVCHFAQTIVGVPFPFNNLISFNGSGGMEFPMMMNTGYETDYYRLVTVTTHEACHMYFPFLVGTNEKKYAWMDEGFVTFLAKEADQIIMPEINPYTDILSIFRSFSGDEQDVALMVPSNQLRGRTYQVHAYYRSSAAIYFLKLYLGDEKFQLALKDFILHWKGRHPTPYDLFFTFNRVAGENLNWFWDAWFFKTGWVDLGVSDVEQIDKGYKIYIENKGMLPVPYNIGIVYTDGSGDTLDISANTWKKNYSHDLHTLKTEKTIKQVYIPDKQLPDKNPVNNYYHVKN
ncbi:MAG: M1 family metallopeptidase [Bacteroidales bacterium]|nr:M1 family metallopeptidase [Bacteroidales bacterium]